MAGLVGAGSTNMEDNEASLNFSQELVESSPPAVAADDTVQTETENELVTPSDCSSVTTTANGRDIPSTPPPMSRIGLNDHKAGMGGLDKQKINQIILEASKGSKFYENEVKKERKVTEKITKLLSDLSHITVAQQEMAELEADRDILRLEQSRDLSNIIVHIDMDAFYAAVEMRDRPHLKKVPMAVGGNSMLVS